MNNVQIPLPILLAIAGAAIGLIVIFEKILIVVVLAFAGFVIGKVMDSPELRQKIKEFFSFE